MGQWQAFIKQLQKGHHQALAKGISIIENDLETGQAILQDLSFNKTAPVIGFTGPPGAGKSTLINSLLEQLTKSDKKIGVLAIDPTSPFNYGALLGDRIRLRNHYTHSNIFIRSLATRGALGGLSKKTVEVVDLMRTSNFDYIFVETVGIGQSEVEIAGLADTTIVVLVPESGDAIQTMKAGVMEIADIFVVNKSDRPDTDKFIKHLKALVRTKPQEEWKIPIIKAVATQKKGVEQLLTKLQAHAKSGRFNKKRPYLLTQKALTLIQQFRMRDIDKKELFETIKEANQKGAFNLYAFLKETFFSKGK